MVKLVHFAPVGFHKHLGADGPAEGRIMRVGLNVDDDPPEDTD